MRTQVAIVGAGAAGLMAARELIRQGHEVLVLEARDRIGGRIFTLHPPDLPLPIELGAEFVHGEAPVTTQLLDEAGLLALEVQGRVWRFRSRMEKDADPWHPLDRVLGKIDSQAADESLSQFLSRHPGGRSLARARTDALRFVEGYHAADSARISVQSIAPERGDPVSSNARRLARVAQGYHALIEHLAREVKPRLRLSRAVRRIAWRRGHARLEMRSAAGAGSAVEARAVIVTAPVGVLGAPAGSPGAIAFDPDPEAARQALARIASGSVIRLVVRFHEPPWRLGSRGVEEEEARALGFVQMSEGPFHACWTAHPGRAPLAVLWSGGPKAAALARGEDRPLLTAGLEALAHVLGTRHRRLAARVRSWWVHNWQRDPYSRGAYSYRLVGGAEAGEALARPIERTLFFAGEATDEASGTVEGALASGRKAARLVANALAASRTRRRSRRVTS
jgi:monoamine oxidase